MNFASSKLKFFVLLKLVSRIRKSNLMKFKKKLNGCAEYYFPNADKQKICSRSPKSDTFKASM